MCKLSCKSCTFPYVRWVHHLRTSNGRFQQIKRNQTSPSRNTPDVRDTAGYARHGWRKHLPQPAVPDRTRRDHCRASRPLGPDLSRCPPDCNPVLGKGIGDKGLRWFQDGSRWFEMVSRLLQGILPEPLQMSPKCCMNHLDWCSLSFLFSVSAVGWFMTEVSEQVYGSRPKMSNSRTKKWSIPPSTETL